MAVAFASVASAASLTVTKPTGLAEGDLMIGHVASTDADAGTVDAHTLTGWTQLVTGVIGTGGMTQRVTVLYKVAVAGDVAASDFTFVADADGDGHCAAIWRITGGAASSMQATFDAEATSDTTPTYTNTVTPTFANSLLLFLQSSGGVEGISADSYAITTNNPTWTERYDTETGVVVADGEAQIAGASASRPETSATGDSSCTLNTLPSGSAGVIVVIPPQLNATLTPGVVNAVLSILAPAVAGSTVLTPGLVNLSLTVPALTLATGGPKWAAESKPSPGTWEAEPKT